MTGKKILRSWVLVHLTLICLFIALVAAPVSADIIIPVQATYMVNFDANGGSPNYTVIVNGYNNIPLPEQGPTKDHYMFIGWNSAKDGSGAPFTQDNMIMSNLTVYAQWEPDNYSILFNSNIRALHWNSTGESPSNILIMTQYGTTIELPDNPVYYGYTFLGWNMAADGSGKVYDASEIVTEHLEVYAQWRANIYTVTFYDWDDRPLGCVSVEYASAVDLPEHPTRTGYRFIGWKGATWCVLNDFSAKAAYEFISIRTKASSEYIYDYQTACLSNIPYGATIEDLLNNLVNDRNTICVAYRGSWKPIDDLNTILISGMHIYINSDGQFMSQHSLIVKDEPKPDTLSTTARSSVTSKESRQAQPSQPESLAASASVASASISASQPPETSSEKETIKSSDTNITGRNPEKTETENRSPESLGGAAAGHPRSALATGVEWPYLLLTISIVVFLGILAVFIISLVMKNRKNSS